MCFVLKARPATANPAALCSRMDAESAAEGSHGSTNCVMQADIEISDSEYLYATICIPQTINAMGDAEEIESPERATFAEPGRKPGGSGIGNRKSWVIGDPESGNRGSVDRDRGIGDG